MCISLRAWPTNAERNKLLALNISYSYQSRLYIWIENVHIACNNMNFIVCVSFVRFHPHYLGKNRAMSFFCTHFSTFISIAHLIYHMLENCFDIIFRYIHQYSLVTILLHLLLRFKMQFVLATILKYFQQLKF